MGFLCPSSQIEVLSLPLISGSHFKKVLLLKYLSTTFNLQMDGQAERTIQTLEDMLRACVIDFKGSWDDHIDLIVFAYNNSYHFSIQMAPYEALYGRRCRSDVCWFKVGEATFIGPDSVLYAMEKVQLIRDRLKTSQNRLKIICTRKEKGTTVPS